MSLSLAFVKVITSLDLTDHRVNRQSVRKRIINTVNNLQFRYGRFPVTRFWFWFVWIVSVNNGPLSKRFGFSWTDKTGPTNQMRIKMALMGAGLKVNTLYILQSSLLEQTFSSIRYFENLARSQSAVRPRPPAHRSRSANFLLVNLSTGSPPACNWEDKSKNTCSSHV